MSRNALAHNAAKFADGILALTLMESLDNGKPVAHDYTQHIPRVMDNVISFRCCSPDILGEVHNFLMRRLVHDKPITVVAQIILGSASL